MNHHILPDDQFAAVCDKLGRLDVDQWDKMAGILYAKYAPSLSYSGPARSQYKRLFDHWYGCRKKDMPQSMVNRIDVRSGLGEFALYIHDGQAREQVAMPPWMEANWRKHFKTPEFKGNGVGVDGRIIFFAPHTEFKKTDFIVGGNTRLEIKFDPCLHKATYKLDDVKGYIAQDAHVLTLFCTLRNILEIPIPELAQMDWKRLVAFYTVLTPDDLRRIQAEVKVRRYSEIGNKLGYQLLDSDDPPPGIGKLNDYGTQHTWGD